MLLRDAQEEVRVVYAARASASGNDPLGYHLDEVLSALVMVRSNPPLSTIDPERMVGIMLTLSFAIANRFSIDSLTAFQNTINKESP